MKTGFLQMVAGVIALVVAVAASEQWQAAQIEPGRVRTKPEDYLRGLPQGEEVEGMLKSIQYEDYVRRLREISALKSASARAVLLRLAYGVEGKHYAAQMASSLFTKTLTEPGDARALLVAGNPAVRHNGLLALRPCQLDEELFELIKRVLILPSPLERCVAAKVLAGMPGEDFAKPKAEVIAQSLKTLGTITNIHKHTVGHDGAFYAEWNQFEAVSCEMAHALGRIKGLPAGTLAALTPDELGMPRDCLMMARAMAGDAAAMPELHRLLTNSPSACVRYHALTPLLDRRPLTDAERAALEYMAAHDPFLAESTSDGCRMVYGSLNSPPGKIHWLRWLAAERLKPDGWFSGQSRKLPFE